MKSVIIIEVETPDVSECTVTPEEGSTEDDYTAEELIEYREKYTKQLHENMVNQITDINIIEDYFLENLEELYVEGWCDFEDYGIKIKCKVNTK
jgi:hypothetical protein